MQGKNLQLTKRRLAALPLVEAALQEIGLKKIMQGSLGQERYSDAILVMLKNVLVERGAIYRIPQWAAEFEPHLIDDAKLNDDVLGRSLDKLHAIDRASLQTKCVLAAVKVGGIATDVIHNDTTSVSLHGIYAAQDKKAIQLRHGHSKDHRPDLKQLVYGLSVSADGAVPIHYKAYDGNQADDATHQETWQTLRGLLGRSDFLYVADSKLCTEGNLRLIDKNQGRFITVVPKTRTETKDFAKAVYQSDVRWSKLWRRKMTRRKDTYDQFETTDGLYQMREGYVIHWYRSSQKLKRDAGERDRKIATATEKLTELSSEKRRGPRTARAVFRAATKIIAKTGTADWITVTVDMKEDVSYRKDSPGKPNKDSSYRRIERKIPKLAITMNHEGIARSKAMDGIFPLTTNTKISSLDVLKHYKYQPKIEKRFSFMKSDLSVAPIFLKNNKRIEALMFVYFLALLVAAVIERKLKEAMVENKIDSLPTLPEGRASKSPTWEQITRLFEHHDRHALFSGKDLVKTFSDPLSDTQLQVLNLLSVPTGLWQKDGTLPRLVGRRS